MKKILVLVLAAAAVGAGLWAWLGPRAADSVRGGVAGAAGRAEEPGAAGSAPSGPAESGAGAWSAQPRGPAPALPGQRVVGAGGAPAELPPSYTRWNPLVPAGANANTQSVSEAARTGRHAERLTALMEPRPFSRAEFEADRQGYIGVIEPGRVWQTAEAAERTPVLKIKGAAHRQIPRGGSVQLAAVGAPHSVITFHSFDLGAFSNRLTTISVLTDGSGEAAATFTATPGTEGEVNILAACPEAVGQGQFIVQVGSE
jgi:hypothetical protein